MKIHCYDNEGKTFDRYTVVYLDDVNPTNGYFAMRGMSTYPFHPQGFGQMCEGQDGNHLGKSITFNDLPTDCQKLVKQDLQSYGD